MIRHVVKAGIRPRLLIALLAAGALGLGTVAVAAPAHAAPAPVAFYVSPTGSDTDSGTAAATPFKTLAKAQAAVRAVDQADSGQVTVYLAGGDYRLTAPLTFTAADSGTNGDIWWRAESGQ